MPDARFEDGAERPLRLAAVDAADLGVIAALVQDAVLTGADVSWRPRVRRMALLLNRFRWEDRTHAAERVRSVLVIDDVARAEHQGLNPTDRDMVLSLLTLSYTADAHPADAGNPAGPGRLTLTFAGDGTVALTVDCVNVTLNDVTRPYAAPSGRAPDHAI